MIHQPLEVVWDFITDVRNDKNWWKAVTHTELLTPEPIQVGSRFDQRASVGPIKVHNSLTIHVFSPPHYMKLVNQDSGIDYDAHYLFEPLTAHSTRFTLIADHVLKKSLWLVAPLLRVLLLRELDRYFNVLKDYLEHERA